MECHVDISYTEGVLRKQLKRWEFDSRRQAPTLNDRYSLGEGGFKSRQPPLSIETVVSYKLRELAGVLHEKLHTMSLYGQSADSNTSPPHMLSTSASRFFDSSSSQHVGGRAEKDSEFAKLCMTDSDWHNIYIALWELLEPAVFDSFQLLLEGSNISFGVSLDQLRAYGPDKECDRHITELREVINIASVACQLGVYGAVEKLRAFDWTDFRLKRTMWLEIVGAEELDQLINWAEEIVYAPMKDFERKIVRETLDIHTTHNMNQGGTRTAGAKSPVPRSTNQRYTKSSLAGEAIPTTSGETGGAHGPHSAISLPLMPLYIRKDEPLIRTMHDIILDYVERNRTPRSDIIDRAAGAADGCTQQ